MKILIYGINYAPEEVGIGKYTGELGPWLASRGHEIHVITAPPYFPGWKVSTDYYNSYQYEKMEGVQILRCPLWVPRYPNGFTRLLHLASFAITSLFPLIAKLYWRPDVVMTIAPAFFCAPGALLLGKLCGSRTINWLHIQDFELDAAFELGLLKGRLLRSIAEGWERYTLRKFDRVSSISTAMVQRLAAKGVINNRILLLSNWVNLDLIQPQERNAQIKNTYRNELGIDSDQIVLMYSGSMNKKQGLDDLVKVIKKLVDEPNVVWLLAGDGPTKPQLVEATQSLAQVRHLPLQPRERLNDWLNTADIHLLPQKAEVADLVLPSKLLGILASGKPIVASSPSGSELAEIAEKAGAYALPGDINSFAKQLRRLISSPEDRAKAGRRARELAEKAFGMDAVLGHFEEELRGLVK